MKRKWERVQWYFKILNAQNNENFQKVDFDEFTRRYLTSLPAKTIIKSSPVSTTKAVAIFRKRPIAKFLHLIMPGFTPEMGNEYATYCIDVLNRFARIFKLDRPQVRKYLTSEFKKKPINFRKCDRNLMLLSVAYKAPFPTIVNIYPMIKKAFARMGKDVNSERFMPISSSTTVTQSPKTEEILSSAKQNLDEQELIRRKVPKMPIRANVVSEITKQLTAFQKTLQAGFNEKESQYENEQAKQNPDEDLLSKYEEQMNALQQSVDDLEEAISALEDYSD